MGRYINWADVANKYAEAAKVGGASETNAPFIASAEDEVDAYLAPRYSVPFTPCPGALKDLTVDLAYYKMTVLKKGQKPLWDYIQLRLKAMADGTLALVVSGTVIDQVGQLPASRVAMVSSVVPVGGYSVEDDCFFQRPQL